MSAKLRVVPKLSAEGEAAIDDPVGIIDVLEAMGDTVVVEQTADGERYSINGEPAVTARELVEYCEENYGDELSL